MQYTHSLQCDGILQARLNEQAEQALATPSAAESSPSLAPSASSTPSTAAAGMNSPAAGATPRPEELFQYQAPDPDQLSDWPILREGEGGKLVCSFVSGMHGYPS